MTNSSSPPPQLQAGSMTHAVGGTTELPLGLLEDGKADRQSECMNMVRHMRCCLLMCIATAEDAAQPCELVGSDMLRLRASVDGSHTVLNPRQLHGLTPQ